MTTIKTEADIEKIIRDDKYMMNVLRAAEKLDLTNWWIGAGFLRNKIWDVIEGNAPREARDIDLVYFNADDTHPETDWRYDEIMKDKYPYAEWEARNQARMSYKNDDKPYASTEDGITHWVETATCIAVRLNDESMEFLWCYGMDDVLNMVARPIDLYSKPGRIELFHKRVNEKGWRERWPSLVVAG